MWEAGWIECLWNRFKAFSLIDVISKVLNASIVLDYYYLTFDTGIESVL